MASIRTSVPFRSTNFGQNEPPSSSPNTRCKSDGVLTYVWPRCSMSVIERQEKDHQRRNDYCNQKNARIIGSIILGNYHLSNVSYSVSEYPDRMSDHSCQPEIAAKPKTQ